jgi:tetratricopeptide (TPR) repeat protein
VGRDIARDEPHYHSPIFTGTIMVEGRYVGPRLFSDWPDLRAAKLVARFGNSFIYRGTYNIAPLISDERHYRGTYALFAEKPDLVAAESLFRRSVEIYPKAFWSYIELGNIYLARGSRDAAVQAYTSARDTAPPGSVFLPPIENQLRLLAAQTPLSQILAVRDPALE